MAWIKTSVIDDTEAHVKIRYVDRDTCKWWNSRQRSEDDVRLFTGFYWFNSKSEGGPFHSRSSAVRDAYYRVVLGIEPPSARDNRNSRRGS